MSLPTSISLSGKRAFITGATSGIGEAIARSFTTAGARVVIHGRDAARGSQIAREIDGVFLAGDLHDPLTPARLVDSLGRESTLDILVNNAGYEVHGDLAELERDPFVSLLEVNLIAPLQLMRLALPLLRRSTEPSIINMTSIHESVPVSGNGAYAASKAALASLTKTASLEFASDGIRVNNIAPGAILTEMNRSLIFEIGENNFRDWIPLGHVGSVEDVANIALFLASSHSRYINGTSIVVDGAYTNHLVRYPARAVSDPE